MVLVLVAACGSSKFPADARQAFTDGCTEGGTTVSQCECIIDELGDVMTVEEFEALVDRTLRPDDLMQQKMIRISRKCTG